MDSVGEGEGGKIWENGIETCKISCGQWVASPGSMHDTGCSKLVLHTVPMERPPQQASHRCCHERAAGCPPPLFAAWAATGF